METASSSDAVVTTQPVRHTQLRGIFAPAVVGLIAGPLIIVTHEFGHYLAGVAHGVDARLQYGMVHFTATPERMQETDVVVTASGPMMETLWAVGGMIWLVRRRARRRAAVPTVVDWIATGCVLAAGRWLRCFTGTPAHPRPPDEAHLSAAMGMPSWVLPYALAPAAVAFLIAAIRLHPPGQRARPFAIMFAACFVGLILWLKVLGPVILPPL